MQVLPVASIGATFVLADSSALFVLVTGFFSLSLKKSKGQIDYCFAFAVNVPLAFLMESSLEWEEDEGAIECERGAEVEDDGGGIASDS